MEPAAITQASTLSKITMKNNVIIYRMRDLRIDISIFTDKMSATSEKLLSKKHSIQRKSPYSMVFYLSCLLLISASSFATVFAWRNLIFLAISIDALYASSA